MEKVYLNPEHPGSLGGVNAFYHAAESKIPKDKIQKWLKGVDAYTLHKPIRKRFQTNRVLVYSIDAQWQGDLVDVSALQKYNQGFRYILTCIDILSKYAWAVPLKTKRGVDIVQGFQKIFLERKPKSLQTDQGTEFKNATFQKFLRENGVRFFTTFNTTKASVVERFNRTLKGKMWRYFTHNHTYHYLDVLDQLMQSYNNTFHSSIKKAPIEVTKENEREVWFTLYGDIKKATPCLFQTGDTVRVSKHKLTFEKGYETNWSDEIFIVTECVRRNPSVYRIKDLLDEPIQGTFYPQELQKVDTKETFVIEKILKKRKRKGRLEYYIKYRGYPAKFNQWISASNLFAL